jgi:hypothetical protein
MQPHAASSAAAHGAGLADLAAAFCDAAERALAAGDGAALSGEELRRLLTVAMKLYALRAEAEDRAPAPIAADRLTPTEVVLIVTEMLRASNLNLFDLAMWYRRAG